MNLPQHIAIVMDGNGRWAKNRSLPRVAGHRAGAKSVREIVEYAAKLGIKVLTLFAFSLENRARPQMEVNFLMELFLESLQRNTAQLHENNIRLRIIGDHHQFDSSLLRQIHAAEELTKNNTGLTLVIAINYSGRWDIVNASQQLAQQVQAGKIAPTDIDQTLFQQYLCSSDLPEPDLLIRTSGEQRISNFMLWQFAYTEIYFSRVYWPDFNHAALDEALQFYATRQRRYGLTPEQVEKQHA
jgi:undecaprenyl diphosphate synthase